MSPLDPLSSPTGDEAVIVDAEEEQLEVARQSKKRRKKEKVLMGEDSGLTEEDRRRIRRDQREVAKLLHDGPVTKGDDDNEEEEENYIAAARERNNELFKSVCYTREAVLDAENVDNIAAKFSKQVDDIVQVPRYDPARFVSKLRSKLTGQDSTGQTFFDWKTLGLEAGVCFNSLPSRVTFLAGPIENVDLPEKKKTVRQKRARIEEEELEEEKPEELANKKQKKTADQLSQAERNLKIMRKVLHKRCKETYSENTTKYEELKESEPDKEKQARRELKERGNEIDFVRFCVHPTSFTQTVENIFNFSFMVKKGEAKIKMRKPEPMGDSSAKNPLDFASAGCFVSEGEHDYDGQARQCVIPFTMRDWRRLVEAYELDKCDVPSRKASKQHTSTAMASSSQHSRSLHEEEEQIQE